MGTYEIDLSEILPKDNYIYEALMFNYIQRNDSSATNTQTVVSGKAITNTVDYYRTMDIYSAIEADKGAEIMNSFMAIIGTDRKLYLQIYSNKLANQTLKLLSYRRVGINK